MFRLCVNDLNIQPEQAWKLDIVDIVHLINAPEQAADLSVMLNFERIQNGASKEWLQNH